MTLDEKLGPKKEKEERQDYYYSSNRSTQKMFKYGTIAGGIVTVLVGDAGEGVIFPLTFTGVSAALYLYYKHFMP